MRIMTIVAGVLLVITSLWCFANPGAAFLSIAFIIGSTMVISGAIATISYLSVNSEKRCDESSWVLAEAILTVILGVLVLTNQIATDAVIPIFFGLWILFSGCMRVVGAIALRKAAEKSWTWVAVLGLISIAVGIYSFVNTIALGLAQVMMIGIFFLLQGINTLIVGINMPHKKK